MNKEALQIGFEKAGRDLGLETPQIKHLWSQALNYPEFRETFDKMSNDSIVLDAETLDTISNLEKVSSLALSYK